MVSTENLCCGGLAQSRGASDPEQPSLPLGFQLVVTHRGVDGVAVLAIRSASSAVIHSKFHIPIMVLMVNFFPSSDSTPCSTRSMPNVLYLISMFEFFCPVASATSLSAS